ncbi:hypothetical protein RRF57_011457 [Xylaria bambusicola]|uniref:Uncharacterized protein n=1 Tax=Xylaria bambusicola TaxID=326684 RepID=A0AAN7UMV4_9PEZI
MKWQIPFLSLASLATVLAAPVGHTGESSYLYPESLLAIYQHLILHAGETLLTEAISQFAAQLKSRPENLFMPPWRWDCLRRGARTRGCGLDERRSLRLSLKEMRLSFPEVLYAGPIVLRSVMRGRLE